MRDPEDFSINTSLRAHRKGLLAALAVFATLLLVVSVTVYYPADHSTTRTQSNTTQTQNTTETVECDKYAAAGGSEDSEGTKTDPFNTAQRLIDSLQPGQTGCLRGGVYTDGEQLLKFKNGGTSDTKRITLQSYPGEAAEFRGSISIPEGSDYVTVRNMRLDGSYGPVGDGHFAGDYNTEQTINVQGNNVDIRGNNITNRRPNGDPDLAGTCIILGSSQATAANTLIEGNRIHHCGQMPRINREHGIYASHPKDAVIQDNLIYDNADRGIQLYPDAQGVLVSGNVFDGNGENLVFGGSGNNVSSDNTVRNNVISNSRVGWNVSGNWSQTSAVGHNNVVRDNCLWASSRESDFNQNGGINPEEVGFDAYANSIIKPGYEDTKPDPSKLGANPCRAMLEDQSGSLREMVFLLVWIDPMWSLVQKVPRWHS